MEISEEATMTTEEGGACCRNSSRRLHPISSICSNDRIDVEPEVLRPAPLTRGLPHRNGQEKCSPVGAARELGK